LNFRRPATHRNRPREARNHDENNQLIRAPFPENFVADEAEEFPPNEILCFDPHEPISYLTKEDYEIFVSLPLKYSDQVA